MSYWWLSFCDPKGREGHKFLGGCIVKANSWHGAITEAWLRGCNPGGEVLGHEIPPQYEKNVARFDVNRLYTSKDELRLLDDQ